MIRIWFIFCKGVLEAIFLNHRGLADDMIYQRNTIFDCGWCDYNIN